MRRLLVVVATMVAMLWVSAPAYAFFRNGVTNPYLHTALDVLTLAVVSAPLWTMYLWGRRRRALLAVLVTVVQLPVAVVGFVPIVDPALHAVAAGLALLVTVAAVVAARRAGAQPASSVERDPAG
jgi:hypothetical protein